MFPITDFAKRSLLILFLFTKSDIKTTIIPITLFASASGPAHSISNVLHCVFWIWVHLLQFDVSNQYHKLAIEEDRLNKSDRPLPSGKLTQRQATYLRWSLVPICLGISASYSNAALVASIAVNIFTIVYNELGAHAGHWAVRNLSVGVTYGSFEVGAVLIAGSDRDQLYPIGRLAVLLSTLIIITTYHSQDFKDLEGDRKFGRHTLPIAHPRVARFTMLFALTFWSVLLSYIWKLHIAHAVAFCCLGLYVGGRFLRQEGVKTDQVSFYWYNIWLSFVHVLPLLSQIGSTYRSS